MTCVYNLCSYIYKWMPAVIEWYRLYICIIIIIGMNVVDNLNSVQVINKPCMSSRCMSLLPRTTLHSDSEQLKTKENATAHSKMGSLKRTIQQECNRKVQLCCSEIVMCSHCSSRRPSLLAEAKAFSSQENILTQLYKTFQKIFLLHRVTAHPVVSKIRF